MKLLKLLLVPTLLLSITTMYAQKYVCGDISMLPKYEQQKATYLDKDGKAIADVLTFLKEQGWNTIRVRLFVDPSKSGDKAVCQDLDYVKALGKRIKDAGLYFMLDFHYSDTWADPEHQTIPALFVSVNTPAYNYIYDYTKEALQALVAYGATPDLIQTGNEISYGMLWDGCKVSANDAWNAYLDTNWDHFATALKNASRACREVCPQAKIIIHTEQCDIIGTSYYPYFKGDLSKLDKGLTQLETNFPEKQIQVVETGYPSKYEVKGTTFDYTKTYPYSHEGQRKYTADLITILKKHNQVNGLNWWYAEANAKGCTGDLKEGWYDASLFDNETGRALPALYELRNFNDGASGIQSIQEISAEDDHWYTIDGRRLNSKPSKSGLYIHQQKKEIVR